MKYLTKLLYHLSLLHIPNLLYQKRRVFQLVAPKEEIYWGKKLKRAPDIVFLTRPYFSVGTCPIEGKIFIAREVSLPGTHDSDRRGIFLAKGVGIKNLLKDWQNEDLHIWDMVKVFDRIFGYENDRINEASSQRRTKLTEKEEEEIKKRLEALGYL